MRWCNWVFEEDCNWKAVSGDIIQEAQGFGFFCFFVGFFLTGDLKRNIRHLMRFQCRGLMSVRGRTAEASGCSGTLMWLVREPLSNSSLPKKTAWRGQASVVQKFGVNDAWFDSGGRAVGCCTACISLFKVWRRMNGDVGYSSISLPKT